MSKFDQLNNAFMASRESFSVYQEECRNFSSKLYDKLIQYLEVDPSNVQLVSINENGAYEPVIPMANALFVTTEGYWYFGVGLSFGYNHEAYKNELTVLHIFFKKVGTKRFEAKLGLDGEAFMVNINDQKTLKPFFDYLFEETKKGFSQELTFLDESKHKSKEKKIGFKID